MAAENAISESILNKIVFAYFNLLEMRKPLVNLMTTVSLFM